MLSFFSRLFFGLVALALPAPITPQREPKKKANPTLPLLSARSTAKQKKIKINFINFSFLFYLQRSLGGLLVFSFGWLPAAPQPITHPKSSHQPPLRASCFASKKAQEFSILFTFSSALHTLGRPPAAAIQLFNQLSHSQRES